MTYQQKYRQKKQKRSAYKKLDSIRRKQREATKNGL